LDKNKYLCINNLRKLLNSEIKNKKYVLLFKMSKLQQLYQQKVSYNTITVSL